MTQLRKFLMLAAVIAASVAIPTVARADYSVIVHGDLSALTNGTQGLLDFQFNPGNISGYDPATATISGFSSSGLSLGSATASGGGSGSLPGGIALDNSSFFNEVYQAFSVTGANASFQFTLTLGGQAINAPSATATVGTTFGLGVLDPNFTPLYGNNDPVLRIDINPTDPHPSVTTVISPPIRLSAVPEPSSLALLIVGLAAGLPLSKAVAAFRSRVAR